MTVTNRTINKASQQAICTSIQIDKKLDAKHLLVDTKQQQLELSTVKEISSTVPSSNTNTTKSTIEIASNIKEDFMDFTETARVQANTEGRVDSFDHVTFWVGNAKQSAVFYMTQFGFEPFAFRGLETGFREHACHVVKLNDMIIQFVSPCAPNNQELHNFLSSHGDAVKDVAFRVDHIEDLLTHALEHGAELVSPLEVETFKSRNDTDGSLPRCSVKRATIKTFGDVTHTFIERNYDYDDKNFLPGYHKPALEVSL